MLVWVAPAPDRQPVVLSCGRASTLKEASFAAAEALAVALSLAPRGLHDRADPLLARRMRSPWHRSPGMTANLGRCSRTLETRRRDPRARAWPRPARGSLRRRGVAVPAGAARRRLANPACERMDVRRRHASGGDSGKTVAQADILAKPANSMSASGSSSPALPTARAPPMPSERCWQGWSSPAHGWGRESSGRSFRSAIRSARSSRCELLSLVRVDDRAQ